MAFNGFVPPTKNYFGMPNEWIDICSEIKDISELKVIQYVLRHTWGFHEYGITKTISVDEFMHGRRRQDGSRMDKGTGLSEQSVRNGLKKAIKDGYLVFEVDPSDAGRIKKSYALKMVGQVQSLDPPQTLDPSDTGTNFIPQGSNPYTSDSQSLDLRVPNFIPRTEKDTIEKHLKKDTIEKQGEIASPHVDASPSENVTHIHKWKEESGKHKAVKKGENHAETDHSPGSPVLPGQPRGDALTGHSSETGRQDDGAPVGQRELDTPSLSSIGTAAPAQRSALFPNATVQGANQDKPPMALTPQQIAKQNEQRKEEIMVLYAAKIGRKPSRSKANLDGALKLAQDDVSDQDINTTIDAILKDDFLAKNLTLTFVYSKLDAFARKPIPLHQSNGTKPATQAEPVIPRDAIRAAREAREKRIAL